VGGHGPITIGSIKGVVLGSNFQGLRKNHSLRGGFSLISKEGKNGTGA